MRLSGRRLEVGISAHGREKAHRAMRVISCPRGDPDADPVGFQFLSARKARKLYLRFGQRQRARFRIAAEIGEYARHQRHLPRLVLAHLGVPRDHVRHLVRQHRSELGRVIGERDQTARHIQISARQGKSVDRGGIENGDAILQIGPLGGGDELGDGLMQERFELGIVVGAVIGRENALVLALRASRGRRLKRGLSWRLRERRGRSARREECRAAAAKGERKRGCEREARAMREARCPPQRSRRTDCSACAKNFRRCVRGGHISAQRSRSAPAGWPRCAVRCDPPSTHARARAGSRGFSAARRRPRRRARCVSRS